ncbi:hypothetical protein FACUT_13803 [Fusarium acutatum]|uniref:Uncharacterized protein n=1 Tax=Fusarium acutatum TaxID=78861 RepID=A0A8H4J853_9HYPO|nr:hypothetical protein FACUT_13803 [Fusarium acutatum]
MPAFTTDIEFVLFTSMPDTLCNSRQLNRGDLLMQLRSDEDHDAGQLSRHLNSHRLYQARTHSDHSIETARQLTPAPYNPVTLTIRTYPSALAKRLFRRAAKQQRSSHRSRLSRIVALLTPSLLHERTGEIHEKNTCLPGGPPSAGCCGAVTIATVGRRGPLPSLGMLRLETSHFRLHCITAPVTLKQPFITTPQTFVNREDLHRISEPHPLQHPRGSSRNDAFDQRLDVLERTTRPPTDKIRLPLATTAQLFGVETDSEPIRPPETVCRLLHTEIAVNRDGHFNHRRTIRRISLVKRHTLGCNALYNNIPIRKTVQAFTRHNLSESSLFSLSLLHERAAEDFPNSFSNYTETWVPNFIFKTKVLPATTPPACPSFLFPHRYRLPFPTCNNGIAIPAPGGGCFGVAGDGVKHGLAMRSIQATGASSATVELYCQKPTRAIDVPDDDPASTMSASAARKSPPLGAPGGTSRVSVSFQ